MKLTTALACITVLAVTLPGCSTLFNKTTTYTMPDGQQHVLNQPSDAHTVVTLADGTKMDGDNRGRPSTLELLFPALIEAMPDITVESD